MTLHEMEIEASTQYFLETRETNNGHAIALLTRDNVARIEAIISLDSNYRNTSNPERRPVMKKDGQYKYIGSTRYWTEELNELSRGRDVTNDGHDYSQTIQFLINAIDNENSTHLNSDGVGRVAVRDRIVAQYSSATTLVAALKNPDGDYALLKLIATPKVSGEKNHFSFATKFCHYCSIFLFPGTDNEDRYSIYDEVLKNALPLYMGYYLKEDNQKEYVNNYECYINYIDRIRAAAKEQHGCEISRNGFDHLVWYFSKGR